MSFKKKGKNQEIDARTVEDFISKLGPETQKFLQEESSEGEGKSTAAKMKTTAHLGPNFGKPGYISPTKKQNQGSRRLIQNDPVSKKPESPVKRVSLTRAPPEERTLATTTKKMQLPLVTSKRRPGDKDDPSDTDPFYREFKVRAIKALKREIILHMDV